MASRGKWTTLPFCERCWHDLNGDRTPVRVIDSPPETCVWCRDITASGIYVRGHISVQTWTDAESWLDAEATDA